jgi:hypothetical protein
VLEREIHDEAMNVSIKEFIQSLNKLVESLDQEDRQRYENILNPKPKEEKQPIIAEDNDSEKVNLAEDQSSESKPPPSDTESEKPEDTQHNLRDDEEEKNTLEPKYKELYRKLAQFLHPDKLIGKTKKEKVEKTEMFKQIQLAISDGDYSVLLKFASMLGIDIEDADAGDISFLKNLISIEERKIQNMRDSWAWNWYHENSTSKKEEIMLEYIKQKLKI